MISVIAVVPFLVMAVAVVITCDYGGGCPNPPHDFFLLFCLLILLLTSCLPDKKCGKRPELAGHFWTLLTASLNVKSVNLTLALSLNPNPNLKPNLKP